MLRSCDTSRSIRGTVVSWQVQSFCSVAQAATKAAAVAWAKAAASWDFTAASWTRRDDSIASMVLREASWSVCRSARRVDMVDCASDRSDLSR